MQEVQKKEKLELLEETLESVVVDSIIIVFAIIFQPEIRRILERVGQANFGKVKVLDDETQRLSDCIDAVSKAAGIKL